MSMPGKSKYFQNPDCYLAIYTGKVLMILNPHLELKSII